MEMVKVKIFYEKIVSVEEEVEIPKEDFEDMTLGEHRWHDSVKINKATKLFDKYHKKFMEEEQAERFGEDEYKEESFSILGIGF